MVLKAHTSLLLTNWASLAVVSLLTAGQNTHTHTHKYVHTYTYTCWLGCAVHKCVLLGCSCVSAELVHQGGKKKMQKRECDKWKRARDERGTDGKGEGEENKREMQLFPKLWGASERWRAEWNAVQMQIQTHKRTHTSPIEQEKWRFVLTCRHLSVVKIKLLWWECENNSSGPAVTFGCRNASCALTVRCPLT